MKAAKFVSSSQDVQSRMENLRRMHKVELDAVFDATDGGYIGAGWLITYVVLNFTVSLSSKTDRIPEEVYSNAIEVFQQAHRELKREKSFFCFVMTESEASSKTTLTILLNNEQLSKKHELVKDVANMLFRLKRANVSFQSMYADWLHFLACYSHRNKRVLAFYLPEPVNFGRHFAIGSKLQRQLLTDEYDEVSLRVSAMLLGNSCFFSALYEEAIEQWRWAAAQGSPVAFFNIACAYSKLGEMEKAYDHCLKAIENNVSREMILGDPDLAEFRRHPLFEKVRDLL